MSQTLTISEASKIIGVHPNTLRNWERKGILVSKRGKENNYRYYSQDQIKSFLLRGKKARFKMRWGYEAAIKRRIEDYEKVNKTLDVCVSSVVTTKHNRTIDNRLYKLARRVANLGVRVRFIRDLEEPIMRERAIVLEKYGFETRSMKIDGLSFCIRDKKLLTLELPSDNKDNRLTFTIRDEKVAKSFSMFYDLIWEKAVKS